MQETYRVFDAAEYLDTEEDIVDLLAVVAEDGDPATMALALGAVARARSMTQIAKATGMTREGLYKALSPGGNPSFSTVAKVARALGVEVSFRVKKRSPKSAEPELAQPARRAKRRPVAKPGREAGRAS